MIRFVKEQDAPSIQIINKEQMGYDYPLNKTVRNIINIMKAPHHHLMLVFEDEQNHEVCGYVHAEIYEETYADPQLNILGIAVATGHQRMGIGKQLLNQLELEARRKKIHKIRLNSGENRTKAHQFYEQMGYVNDKKQKRFFKTFN